MHSSLWQGHSPRCSRQRADTAGQQALQPEDINAVRNAAVVEGANMASAASGSLSMEQSITA